MEEETKMSTQQIKRLCPPWSRLVQHRRQVLYNITSRSVVSV